MKIKGSHIVALVLAAAIGGWMYTGETVIGGQSEGAGDNPAIVEREAERALDVFRVSYLPLQPEERFETILVRGRTQADAVVSIRAETPGILQERLVSKGDQVNKGDLVCVIDQGARAASVAQAEAQLAQAEAEFTANETLAKKGFAATNKLNSMRAALDAAKASLAQAKLELSRTEIRANASGIVQDPIAETGDMLSMGNACVTLIDTDPMLFIGQISERDIGKVTPGMDATVTLVSGEEVEGKVRYIAPSADASTRTFRTEIEIRSQQPIRDGLTASALLRLEPTKAYRVSPGWLTLADNGEIGLRIANSQNVVEFVPVNILAQTKEGFWVSGPAPGMRAIVLGQDYVAEGAEVDPVPAETKTAEASS